MRPSPETTDSFVVRRNWKYMDLLNGSQVFLKVSHPMGCCSCRTSLFSFPGETWAGDCCALGHSISESFTGCLRIFWWAWEASSFLPASSSQTVLRMCCRALLESDTAGTPRIHFESQRKALGVLQVCNMDKTRICSFADISKHPPNIDPLYLLYLCHVECL